MKFVFSFLLVALTALPLHAFELQLPVECEIGKDCFVQNYVDQAAGTGYKDYECNQHTYDKHDGTDIRLPTAAEMQKGVNVLASADGTVLGVRDGMQDISIKEIDPASIKGRECGNGVVIRHADGYQTQYCHMKKGSVHVVKSQIVKAGDVLGQIGFSGAAEFPHLHLSVRKDGKKIDPFNNAVVESGCGQKTATLWSAAAAKALEYNPTSVLKTGFVSTLPAMEGIVDGKFDGTALPKNAPVLIYWTLLMGLQQGDDILLTLKNPAGEILVKNRKKVEAAKAQYFQFIGKKLRMDSWPVGGYTGNIEILRNGLTIAENKTIFKVN